MNELVTEKLAAIGGVRVDHSVTFAEMTTLRVGGAPRLAARCATPEAAASAVELLDAAGVPLLVIGGGSNLVIADDTLGAGELDLVAVVMECDGVDIDAEEGIVRAEAGAVWDDVVKRAVEADLGGIECLSGIPGSAGAVPVQNVGAYGAEISEVLTQVRLYDRESGVDEWVPASDLELAYRYSNLKFTNRAVVLEIELTLSTDGLSKPLRFGQLTQNPGERLPVAQVREKVLELRASKGMVLDDSDHDTWSAGSFFTNPVVPLADAERVRETVRGLRGDADADRMPLFDAVDSAGEPAAKLSAAWLIERAGFPRGYRVSAGEPAGLSTKHTLALTNRGGAGTADVVKLARTIRDGVRDAFGIALVPEPVWVGCAID